MDAFYVCRGVRGEAPPHKRKRGGGSATLKKQGEVGTTAPPKSRGGEKDGKTLHSPKGGERGKHHHTKGRWKKAPPITQAEEGERCTTLKEAGKQHRPQGGRGERRDAAPFWWCCFHVLFVGGAAFSPSSFGVALFSFPSSLGVLLWLVLMSHLPLVWYGAVCPQVEVRVKVKVKWWSPMLLFCGAAFLFSSPLSFEAVLLCHPPSFVVVLLSPSRFHM